MVHCENGKLSPMKKQVVPSPRGPTKRKNCRSRLLIKKIKIKIKTLFYISFVLNKNITNTN